MRRTASRSRCREDREGGRLIPLGVMSITVHRYVGERRNSPDPASGGDCVVCSAVAVLAVHQEKLVLDSSGAFHLILRVLMWIASRSREAMIHMNTTYSPGEPGQGTVVGIALGGGGRGGGSPPPRTSRTRGTMHQSRRSPTRQIGAVFMEILAAMLH